MAGLRAALVLLLASGCVGEDATIGDTTEQAAGSGGQRASGSSSTGAAGEPAGGSGGGPPSGPTVTWAEPWKSSGKASSPCGIGTVAASGDAVVGGQFESDMHLGGEILSAIGNSDLFLAHRSRDDNGGATGHSFAGNPELGCESLATNGLGTALVGHYFGTPNFGTGPLVAPSGSGPNAFVASFGADGSPRFAEDIWGDGTHALASVAMDDDGQVFVVGTFASTMTIGNTTRTADEDGDVLVAALAPDGGVSWVQQLGDTSYQTGAAIAYGEDGTIYVAGLFEGDIDLGGEQLEAKGYYDIFVAAFDAGGSVLWSRRLVEWGDGEVDALVAVPESAGGGAWLVGGSRGAVLGVGRERVQLDDDRFALRLLPGGAFGDHLIFDGSSDSVLVLRAAAVDDTGRLLLGGYLTGSVSFDGEQVLESAPCSMEHCNDVVVALFDGTGRHLWSSVYGSADSNQVASGVAFTPGGFYLTGHFQGAWTLGPFPFDERPSTTFVARFDAP